MAIKPSRWQDGSGNRLVILELVDIKQAIKGRGWGGGRDVATLQYLEASPWTKTPPV